MAGDAEKRPPPRKAAVMEDDKNKKSRSVEYGVRAFMAFARTIRPGFRANLLAKPLIALIKTLGIRKDVARRNIMFCFPEKSRAERAKILSESYENMIWTGVELLAWQKDPSMIERMVEKAEGLEHIEEALKAGKGAVVFSAHLGNWELAAAWVARHYPFYGVVRHSDSPFQRELIETLRERAGLRTISKDASMMRVITILKKNEIFGALADQHGGGGDGIPAPFFGIETPTAPGPAAFSVLTGAPMIPFSIRRIAPFRFTVKAGAPLAGPGKGKSRDEAIKEMAAKMNAEFEKMIREAPGQWLWQHRRFREIISD